MTTEFYKYRANLERKYSEGYSDAMAKMKASENDKQYYGDELVAKVRKHDGTEFYYVRACVFEEMLKYIGIINEVADTIFHWENVSGTPKGLPKNQVHFTYFLKGVIPNKDYIESMKNCFKGSHMMDFYRDPQKEKTSAEAEKVKNEVLSLWGF